MRFAQSWLGWLERRKAEEKTVKLKDSVWGYSWRGLFFLIFVGFLVKPYWIVLNIGCTVYRHKWGNLGCVHCWITMPHTNLQALGLHFRCVAVSTDVSILRRHNHLKGELALLNKKRLKSRSQHPKEYKIISIKTMSQNSPPLQHNESNKVML